MPQVFIVAESGPSPMAAQIVATFKHTILAESTSVTLEDITVVTAADLTAEPEALRDRLLCPLTLDLPESLTFPGHAVYTACRHIDERRQQLEQWGYATGDGNLWLPIVLTAKGPLYAEVIGIEADTTPTRYASEPRYIQPVHLTDAQRQPLYALGQRLLQALAAHPSVYLLQFTWQADAICFDRLLPFPDGPAIASLGVQTPDLFVCHWYCIIGKPITDITIASR